MGVPMRPAKYAIIGTFLAIAVVLAFYSRGQSAEATVSYFPSDATETTAWTGRLRRIDDHLAIITVRGTPKERGTAHGKLLKSEVKALVDSVREHLSTEGAEHYRQCVDGGRVMRKFVEKDVTEEL